MVDALVSNVVKKLTTVLGHHLELFGGAADELEGLKDKFESIQAVLADAESRQVEEKSVGLWLSRLRRVAYDIEDLVEEWQISDLGDQDGNEVDGNSRNKGRAYFHLTDNRSYHVVSRYKIAGRIKKIRERLEQIAVDRNMFGFSSSPVCGVDGMLVRGQRLTTSLMNKSEMVIGRENEKETMVSRLVSESSTNEDQGQVQVVSIVGIGGLGKTTLARLIYHDAKVRDHFNQALYWVCVSESFDVIRLTKEIIEQVKSKPPTLSGLNALQDQLLQSLRGKRYLLVLDDVWNDDAEKWEMLRLSLISGAHGSRILVTTRSHKVANSMNATYIHELKGLSDNQSWTLFNSRAFAGKRAGDCSELESIGKEIVNKCKGVPLSIKVIGSAMHSKKTVEDWKNVLESKIWSLPQAIDKILPALLLTYFHLPSHLKQCFAYCSVFPKDWKFKKDVLVRLWVAQGFIWSEGNREMEDIGEEYFDELVAWSMFQEVREDYRGTVCKMHDLLHDLAEFISKDEIYCTEGRESAEWSDSSSICNVRHAFLSFIGSDNKPNKIPIVSGRAKKLRTLWLKRTVDGGINTVIDDLFHKARFIRVLHFPSTTTLPKSIGELKHLRYLHMPNSEIVKLPNAIVKMMHLRYLYLHGSNIVELPNAIGKMKQLRHLGLSGLKIEQLPESVSDLHNLHTLNLSNCHNLKKLPRGIGRMVRLRHLEIEFTPNLEYLPKGLGGISCLQSLSKFIVGGGGGGGGCKIEELRQLDSLQGSLEIEHLERVSSREEAEKAELWNKPHLRRLVLEMLERDDGAESERIGNVVEGLRPHGNIEELELDWYKGSKFPCWMEEMPCLHRLTLYVGPKLEGLPHLPRLKELAILGISNEILPDGGWEQLATLQKLLISSCGELKRLPDGLTQLQSLEHLEIIYCNKLESLPDGFGQLKKLKSLEITCLEALTCLPDSLGQLESLESLYISYCNQLWGLPEELGELKALKELSIIDCEEFWFLPDGWSDLPLLRELKIYDCPLWHGDRYEIHTFPTST